jgi:hypothetical protein
MSPERPFLKEPSVNRRDFLTVAGVYGQVEMAVPYAVSTHFKTTVANDDGQTRSPYDWDCVMKMFVAGGYRGYLGLEFEATGDPVVEVPATLRKLKSLAASHSA